MGAGNTKFEDAADRLSKQVHDFRVFNNIETIKTKSLLQLIPELSADNPFQTRGFGFYRWKPRILLKALEGAWGRYAGVCFADAGCEANVNLWSKRNLVNRLRSAEDFGVLAYAIDTPERHFTKRYLMEKFSAFDIGLESWQFQTGTIYLSGQTGLEIARTWDNLSWESIENVNDEFSGENELPGFFEHRHDQSVFSLILKSRDVLPAIPHPPGYDLRFRPRFQNVFEPFWWARNRSGIDLRGPTHKTLTKLTLNLKKGHRAKDA